MSAMKNSVTLESWPEILYNSEKPSGCTSFKLTPCLVLYNRLTHKKELLSLNRQSLSSASIPENIDTFDGYELEALHNLVILDLDFANKHNQANNLLTECADLCQYLKLNSKIFYWETTMSNGIHIVMCVDSYRTIITTPEMNWGSLPSSVTRVDGSETKYLGRRVEFKTKCLVAPTPKYNSQGAITKLGMLSIEHAKHYILIIVKKFFGVTAVPPDTDEATLFQLDAYIHFEGGEGAKPKKMKKITNGTPSSSLSSVTIPNMANVDSFLEQSYTSNNKFFEHTEQPRQSESGTSLTIAYNNNNDDDEEEEDNSTTIVVNPRKKRRTDDKTTSRVPKRPNNGRTTKKQGTTASSSTAAAAATLADLCEQHIENYFSTDNFQSIYQSRVPTITNKTRPKTATGDDDDENEDEDEDDDESTIGDYTIPNNTRVNQDFEQEKPLSQRDAYVLHLIEEVTKNADQTNMGKHVALSNIRGLYKAIKIFLVYIQRKEHCAEFDLFPENVKFFLEILRCSDVFMQHDPEKRLVPMSMFSHTAQNGGQTNRANHQWSKCLNSGFPSIFSRLASTPVWKKWTFAFLRLMDVMNVMNPSIGKNRERTNYFYSIYRSLTLLNPVGAAESEQVALDEFWNKYDKFVKNMVYEYSSVWTLFFDFVLVVFFVFFFVPCTFAIPDTFFLKTLKITLASVHLNCIVVSQFKKFVDHCDQRTGEMHLYYTIFKNIKLTGIPFEINYTTEENDRGVTTSVALINFLDYPWLKTNTELFKAFIGRIFPHLTNINKYIEFIGTQHRLEAITQSNCDLKFGHWTNCIPFLNGIFEIDLFEEFVKLFCKERENEQAAAAVAALPVECAQEHRSACALRTLHDELKQKDTYSYNDFSRKQRFITSSDIMQTYKPTSIYLFAKLLLQTQKINAMLQRDMSMSRDTAATKIEPVSRQDIFNFLNKFSTWLGMKHALDVTVQDLLNYRYFVVYRNYLPRDVVLNPIDKKFSPYEYCETFESTHLLSLDNYSRYSREFCLYMRSLFGTCANEGLMGPFQYMRMMVIFIFLAQGLLRTKLLQVGINFVGDGSNGKSFFIHMLKTCLGDKMVNVESHVMYGNTSETNQQGIGIDDACFTYDADAAFAELGQFKKAVTDKEAPLKRKLYRGLDRTLRNYTTPILASNIPLRYLRNSKDDIKENYESAFHRRVIVMVFTNVLGKSVKRNKIGEQLHCYDDYLRQQAIDNFETFDRNRKQKLLKKRTSRKLQDEATNSTAAAEDDYFPHEFVDDDNDVEQTDQDEDNTGDERSIFSRNGLNLCDKQTLHNIQVGLFWYILDTLHVFNLGKLNASEHDYVNASYASQRYLGQANYFYLRLLMEHYYFLDQIETDISVIYQAPPVDLVEFYTAHAPKSFKPEMIGNICRILSECFNIIIDMTNSSLDTATWSGESDADQQMRTGLYCARGLLKKSECSSVQFERMRKQPYADITKQVHEEDCKKMMDWQLLEERVESTIPIGHVFQFGSTIKPFVYKAILDLCTGKKIHPLAKPLVSKNWKNRTLTDLLTADSF